MSGVSWDPNDFDLSSTSREGSSSRAEVERWLQTMEGLLSDVADDPDLAESLARVIARTRARHQVAADRTKRTLSSIDSILQRSKRLGTGEPDL
jgi:hypothetical protein